MITTIVIVFFVFLLCFFFNLEMANRTPLIHPKRLRVNGTTRTTAHISWVFAPNNRDSSDHFLRALYWREGEHGSLARHVDVSSTDTSCLLENLDPGTDYCCNIFILSVDEHERSSNSSIRGFWTLDEDLEE